MKTSANRTPDIHTATKSAVPVDKNRSSFNQLLDRYSLLFLSFLAILSSAAIIWHFYRLTNSLQTQAAIESATLHSTALREFRTLYTSEVVSRLGPQTIVTHDYLEKDHAVPLPATLSMELGERIGQYKGSAKSRLYSNYPFPWRKDGGPHDKFERDALIELRKNPGVPVSRFETVNGKLSLRYATADRMRASCVECHNTHDQSPKTDWKTGDVRGVLEIILPIDAVEKHVSVAIKKSVTLMISIVGIGLGLLFIVIRRLRQSISTAELLAEETDKANQDLKLEIEQRRNAENSLAIRTVELESTNQKLQYEVDERLKAAQEVKQALEDSELARAALQKFNRFAVRRESKMIELKKEVNRLMAEHGMTERYDLKDIEKEQDS